MIDRTTRLRWRRRIRRGKRQVEDIGVQAEESLEKHFFKRLVKLPGVLRFTVTWLLLLVLLIGGLVVQTRALDNYFLVDKPVSGGTFVEGVHGSFTNANPLFATNAVNRSVSRLVFAGLLKYDEKNNLVNDLANSWRANESGTEYTVNIPANLKWQDGHPLTVDDVVFTFQTIQNPDVHSPLLVGWKDVSIVATSPQTVVFKLANPLSTFAAGLTTGLIPKHLLQNVPADQLRSVAFNTASPVGAGPFKWDAVQVDGQTPETRQEQIALLPYEDYVGGKPKLSKFIIKAFHDENSMVNAFRSQDLNAMVGLNNTPSDLQSKNGIYEHSIPLMGETMVFFKITNPVLNNVKVRQALIQATDRGDIIQGLGYPVLPADEPLLKSSLGYNPKYAEANFNLNAARQILQKDGWKLDAQNVLAKKDQQLKFTLYTQDSQDYKYISNKLQSQWAQLGVQVDVKLQNDTELQQTISNHSYDSLLYSIEMGPDPDVFAYWGSSQADVRAPSRTNFSEYKSATADASLEAGRTRLLPQLRTIKYRPFLQAWKDDAPAVALFQPRFLYITRGQIFGFKPNSLAAGINRYANVNNWMIREDKKPIEND